MDEFKRGEWSKQRLYPGPQDKRTDTHALGFNQGKHQNEYYTKAQAVAQRNMHRDTKQTH